MKSFFDRTGAAETILVLADEGREWAGLLRLKEPVVMRFVNPEQRVTFHRELQLNPFAVFFGTLNSIVTNIDALKTAGRALREVSQ